ncbi:hypothetical protein OB69_14310 [Roseivirga seohaensis subsp. aquiponti]|uniref:DUF5074 domain-containing protein n=1 Tax=Roseivirga seohaensis subsp. aquiponti TaxID=1566026 RepID=A0A0L8AI10_9BACT|nr:hypothetical protein [Roseivirga seohaensis]KOF01911.1 hypothetical protein OB69_14310 [Roseivirga seohaensis subsp. aquiponti]
MYKKLWFICLFIFTLSFVACDTTDDSDPTQGSLANISFKKIMELSPFAAAENISVSPNEKYMIFSYRENTTVKNYYSKDGGESVQELFIYGNNKDKPIQTNISNNGLFVTSDGGVYDLNNIRSGSAAVHYATGVTDSGKLIYIQNEGANGKTFFIDNNGTYESTGVQLTMDEDFYLGTSGEKMGFFDWRNRIIAEFDVSTQTYTQTTLADLNYSSLYGLGNSRNKVKTAYSYGHFAYAKEGGVIIITPSQEIRYYNYPADYQIWQNTEGGMKLFGGHAYVNIFDRWGAKKVYVASGTTVEPVDHDFAVCRVGETTYTQGFIENGDRFRGGIIKTVNARLEYLPLDMGYKYPSGYMFGKTYLVGDYAYAEDKVFDTKSGKYATSPTGEITSIFYDGGRTIAYTESGTYTTVNGRDWNLETTDKPAPELVTKGTDGIYHALTVHLKVYVSPSTQARTYSVDLKAYTSNNGINWTEVTGSAANHLGYGPRLISSDGVVYTKDTNAGSIGSAKLSEDYGASWQGILNGRNLTKDEPLPDGFKTSQFELSTGKFVSIVFEFSGEMGISVCDSSTGGCTDQVLQVSFDASDMYTHDEEITLTANDEFVFNTLDGIYLSSSIR